MSTEPQTPDLTDARIAYLRSDGESAKHEGVPVEWNAHEAIAILSELTRRREASRVATCGFCGHQERTDGDAGEAMTRIADHMMTCAKHPVRKLVEKLEMENVKTAEFELENAALRTARDLAEAKVSSLDADRDDITAENNRLREENAALTKRVRDLENLDGRPDLCDFIEWLGGFKEGETAGDVVRRVVTNLRAKLQAAETAHHAADEACGGTGEAKYAEAAAEAGAAHRPAEEANGYRQGFLAGHAARQGEIDAEKIAVATSERFRLEDAMSHLAQLATVTKERDEARAACDAVSDQLDGFEQKAASRYGAVLLKKEKEREQLIAQRDAAMSVLSSLSSWLGSGLGDDQTTPDEYERRIRAGVDDHVRVANGRIAGFVESATANSKDFAKLAATVDERDKTIAEQAAEIARLKAEFASRYVSRQTTPEMLAQVFACLEEADKVILMTNGQLDARLVIPASTVRRLACDARDCSTLAAEVERLNGELAAAKGDINDLVTKINQ